MAQVYLQLYIAYLQPPRTTPMYLCEGECACVCEEGVCSYVCWY